MKEDDSRYSKPLDFFRDKMAQKMNNVYLNWEDESIERLLGSEKKLIKLLSLSINSKDQKAITRDAIACACYLMMIVDNAQRMDFHRDDEVTADGKKWRVDYVTGSCLGLSSADGSHKELSKEVCAKVDHTFDGIVTP